MVFDPLTGRSTAAGKEAAMDDRHAKFESLPEERREAIVSAAVETFGKNDYKNASTETIARRAGISKGLLFFYFKNKKELYLYLMEHLMEKVSNLVLDEGYWEIDDFFELLVYAAETKSKVLSKFPYLLEFSIRAFYPEHKDIKDTMDSWTQRQLDFMFTTYFKNVRFDQFRDDIDPKYVLNMLIWLADGYLHQQQALHQRIDLDAMMDEMYRWCDMLKAYSYKEEYRGR